MNSSEELRFGQHMHSVVVKHTRIPAADDRTMEDFGESMRLLREVNREILGGDIPRSQTFEVVQRAIPTHLHLGFGINSDFNLESFPPQMMLLDDILLTTPGLASYQNVKKIGHQYTFSTHPMFLAFSIGTAEDINGTPIDAYTMYRIAGGVGPLFGNRVRQLMSEGVTELKSNGIIQIEELGPFEEFFPDNSSISPVLMTFKAEDFAGLAREKAQTTVVDFNGLKDEYSLARHEATRKTLENRRKHHGPSPAQIPSWGRKRK